MSKRKKIGYSLVAAVVGWCLLSFLPREGEEVTTVLRPQVSTTNRYYVSNRAPLTPLRFIQLPIGSIEPQGWIKKYLQLQRNGLTGHLGEISAWLDKKNNAWYSGNGTGDHGWEEVPYWLKGYGDLGYLLHDTAIIKETRRWLDKMFESQRADGYFGPAIKDNQHPSWAPDLWPNMLVLWCMQSYYDYSHDRRVLPFMSRYFRWEASIADSAFLKRYWENSRGGDNLYSIYWLYDRTGEPWLLQLAGKVHRNTANWTQQDRLPNWHNVNVAECFREPATYYMQAKDSFYLNATYHDFFLVRQEYGQVPGGMFGADENARKGFTDPRQAVETCGMVEQMASDEILASISGDPMWADHCEQVAFNTYPAAVMPDFKGLRYLTAPNMVVSDSKDHSPGIENGGPFLMMNPFSSRCCQHNHAQGWPYYAGHLWMATPDNGLVAMLYNSCTVTAQVGEGEKVTLHEDTHYPFSGEITFRVATSKAAAFPLYFRIPAWCTGASLYINNQLVPHRHEASSYTRVARTWKNNDVVKLVLPMKVSVQRWEHNKNSASVNYGPLTFSLLICEQYQQRDSKASAIGDSRWQAGADASQWPSFEIFPGSPWNYGLLESQVEHPAAMAVIRRPWPKDDFPFTQQQVPLEIITRGKQIEQWKIDKYGLCDTLPESPLRVPGRTESLRLIPMGAARLRIAAFPLVADR